MKSSIWIVFIVLLGCTPNAKAPPNTPPPVEKKVEVQVVVPDIQTAPPASGAQKYQRSLTREARAVYGLNAPIAAFAAQIHQESSWDEQAISPVGARGLAQFMPATAEDVAKDFPELGKASPTNAEWAIRAMVRYMKQIDERITAVDECNHHAFTLSGYNGGLGWVLRDKKATLNIPGLNSEVWWGNVEAINAGRNDDAFRENRGYPRRIIKKLQPHYASWGRMVCVS